LRFDPEIRVRRFSLLRSILEQIGGRKEKRKIKNFNFQKFSNYFEKVEICGQSSGQKIFDGCLFLIHGVGVSEETVRLVVDNGGTVTGAWYEDAEEWGRITHILLGEKIDIKKLKNFLMRIRDFVLVVNSEFISGCVNRDSRFIQYLGPSFEAARRGLPQVIPDIPTETFSPDVPGPVRSPAIESSPEATRSMTPPLRPPELESSPRRSPRFSKNFEN
jgi:hypothetical protein